MGGGEHPIKSIAVVGAGAAGKFHARGLESSCPKLMVIIGVITAAALDAENYYEKIQVFERRETAGGTWYDPKVSF